MADCEKNIRAEHHQLLLEAIAQPADLVNYNNQQWELLLRLARRAQLSGYLAARLEKGGMLGSIPLRAANLLHSSLIQAKTAAIGKLGIEPGNLGAGWQGSTAYRAQRHGLPAA